jgi:hypothetical protein
MAGLDFSGAVTRLEESITAIPELAEVIRYNQLEDAAARFDHVAEVEAEAYSELSKIVSTTSLPTKA